MDSGSPREKWLISLLYLACLVGTLCLIQTLIATRLIIGRQPISIKKKPGLPLRFGSDGTFKILQVADMHYANGLITRCRDVFRSEFDYCSDQNTTQFLRKVIEAEKPDLVAFTGDNIFGASTSDAAESLFGAFDPVIKSQIPWAAILGNHDHESSMTREELMSLISLMDYSVSRTNPSDADSCNPSKGQYLSTCIDGFGNYDVGVYGACGSHLANTSVLNLFFLDSGDRSIVNGIPTYGWIKESQLRWVQSISQNFEVLKEQRKHSSHSSEVISPPVLAFFHIPIPEVRMLYSQKFIGQFQEAVACSFVNSGVLKTFGSMGVVKAVFMGHDHANDFCGNIEGIWFCYGGGFGYHGYGRAGWHRRARIILAELEKGANEWLGVKRIRTWKRLDNEKLGKLDEQILWETQ